MKRNFFLFVLTAVLLVSVLSACSPATVALPQNIPTPTNGIAPAPTEGTVPSAEGTAPPTAPVQKPETQEAAETISPEKAQSISLDHAGFRADQVTGLRVKYDVDDGVPLYEVEFRNGRWEYDYEIHAKTGAILSFEKDD